MTHSRNAMSITTPCIMGLMKVPRINDTKRDGMLSVIFFIVIAVLAFIKLNAFIRIVIILSFVKLDVIILSALTLSFIVLRFFRLSVVW